MVSFRTARGGVAPVFERVVAPVGALLRVDQPEGGPLRAACLALDQDRAEMLLDELALPRRRAMGWARSRWRMLPASMRARLGALRERPIFSDAACPDCRFREAPLAARRLCVMAGRNRASAGAVKEGDRVRLRFSAQPEFVAGAGEGGLRLELLGLELANIQCASC